MTLSIIELAQAREITDELLTELGLEAYLFEIEPHEDEWRVIVECVCSETKTPWSRVSWPVSKKLLLACGDNETARRKLLTQWQRHLSACMAHPS
ncbi:MAG: hypothetical protein AB1810_07220 [Pseudomonadota bacterium]